MLEQDVDMKTKSAQPSASNPMGKSGFNATVIQA